MQKYMAAASILCAISLLGMLYLQKLSVITTPETNIMSKTLRLSPWRQPNGSIDFEMVTKSENFVISVLKPRPVYRVGNQLSIKIVAMDSRGRPKSYGGDFIRAKLYSRAPVEASTAGRVTDYGNGTYTAMFFLSFPGTLSVSVKLVHPSEAVQALKKFRDGSIVRRVMVCGFQEKTNVTEWMFCSNTPNKSLNLRDVCDFSRPLVNVTFYCDRPRFSPCDSFVGCHRDHSSTLAMHDKMATADEKKLFPRDRDLLEELPRNISIQVKGKRLLRKVRGKPLPLCAPRLPETASEGYWFNGNWNSLRCQARRFRTVESVTECLQNKTLFFRGDSTIRQWFRYLMLLLKLQQHGRGSQPLYGIDEKNNIKFHFLFHKYPRNQMPSMDGKDMGYVAEEIDGIIGGKDVVILISLWAHFSAEPIQTFRSRLYGIRHAIERLHSRHPETKIIWRSPNTGHHQQFQHFVENGDWYAFQLLPVVYEILGDLNISIINVWEMSESMWHNDDMHPPDDVIKNHVDLLLSYICPFNKG